MPSSARRSGEGFQAASTTSNDLGEYALRLWASADRIPLTTLPPGDETHFVEDLPIDPRATEVEHDVLLPLAEIRGTVRDAEVGTPIAGADVAVSTSPDKGEAKEEIYARASVTSDREGRFRLRNLVSRRVDVHVQHEGYAPADFYEIEVTPEGKDLEVRMEKGVRLHGVVTGEIGRAAGRRERGHGPGRARARLRPRGHDVGRRRVRVSRHGDGLPHPGSHGVRPQDRGAAHGRLLPRGDPGGDEANIQLGPETEVLHVHVEDDTGAPLDGLTLQWTVHGVLLPLGAWQQYATSCGQPIATDGEGNLELHGMPRDTIGAVAPGSAQPLGSFNNDGTRTSWTIVIPKEQ